MPIHKRVYLEREEVALDSELAFNDPDTVSDPVAYVEASISDELHFVLTQIFNGLETGLLKIETPADEALEILLTRARKALTAEAKIDE